MWAQKYGHPKISLIKVFKISYCSWEQGIHVRVNLDLRSSQRWLGLAHGLGTWFVVAHGIVPWYCMWWSLYKTWGYSIVKWPRGEQWLARLVQMASFGHVMKIFIGAGFPRMGFLGYIVCLYVVACFNVYFLLIIILYCLFIILTFKVYKRTFYKSSCVV